MRQSRTCLSSIALIGLGALLGYLARSQEPQAQGENDNRFAPREVGRATPSGSKPAQYLQQSPEAGPWQPDDRDWGLGDGHISKLLPYPPGNPGVRTPFDLWRYAGKGQSSWGSPDLGMPFEAWVRFHEQQKPGLMAEVLAYMRSRFDFARKAIPGATMSRGKPILQGPTARLPDKIRSFDELTALTPDEIKQRDLFPYKPLAHPLQTTAHMLFPEVWLEAHPEHRRIDVDFDIPEDFLPEFPPPMFLTTHKELGDVTQLSVTTFCTFLREFSPL
ncbi:MAG: hypothetical protein EXS05_15240 [Planctomycetaceae bacterium]|nr:hypothetical protein [Planctomycetaceae bacterium]